MSSESRFCSECGAPLEEGAQFCGKCGAPVSDHRGKIQSVPEPEPAREKPQETRENDKGSDKKENNSSKYVGLIALIILLLVIAGGGAYLYFEQQNKKSYAAATPLAQTPSNSQGESITLLGETYNPNSSADPKKYTDKAKKIVDKLERNQNSYSKDQQRIIWNDVIENIQMAISLDDAEAYYLLALIYEDGYGDTRRDLRKMVDNFTISAEKGYVEAQYILGEMYKDGDEVVKDRMKAIFWFKQAAKQGHKDAKFELKYLTNP